MGLLDYTYSIPYLIFFGYLVLLMFLEFYFINKILSTKIIHYLVIIGFLFFFGLRGIVGFDWINYYPYFQNLPTIWNFNGFDFYQHTFEIGFEWYSIIIKSIWNNYFFWTFINTLIDIILLNLIFKRYSKYYVLSFILFIIFNGLTFELNLYRNSKSILIFLVSLKYLEKRKLIKYMILNLVGVLFHISSILFLPLYFFLHKKFSIKLIISIFIIGNIIFLFQIKYIEPFFQIAGNMIGGRIQEKIMIYFASEGPYGITMGYIERFFSYLIILFYFNKLTKTNKHNIIFVNSYILYFISFFFLNEMFVATDRISTLFIFSYWILFPNIYNLIISISRKYFFITILIVYSILKLEIISRNIFLKYDNLLFGVSNYEERKSTYHRYFGEWRNE